MNGDHRWNPFCFKRGAHFDQFWRAYISLCDRDILFIVGSGIDPRMCSGVSRILSMEGVGKRDCLVLNLDEGIEPSSENVGLLEFNLKELGTLVSKHGLLKSQSIAVWNDTGPNRRRVAAIRLRKYLEDPNIFAGYSDVILDINSMSRGIYMPLLAQLLSMAEGAKSERAIKNLHIVCGNDPTADKLVTNTGLDDAADYIFGFSGDIEMQATMEISKLWIPILGEGQESKLEKLYTLVKPEEICPVFPSPCLDGQRNDAILREYWQVLLDVWGVEPGNILYASDSTPFDIYRQIHRVVTEYRRALRPLGGCKIVVSPLGSKVLSIGSLLACYELKVQEIEVAMAHVESQGYELTSKVGGRNHEEVALCCAWLSGECYED